MTIRKMANTSDLVTDRIFDKYDFKANVTISFKMITVKISYKKSIQQEDSF